MKKIAIFILIFSIFISVNAGFVYGEVDDECIADYPYICDIDIYTHEELHSLFPEVDFSDDTTFIYLKEQPAETYYKEIDEKEAIWLYVFSDNSVTYGRVVEIGDKDEKEYRKFRSAPVSYNVTYSDGNPVYGYTMGYTVTYNHNAIENTITLLQIIPGGNYQFNVSINALHYHRSGGSLMTYPAVFSTDVYATTHGHFGLYVSDPLTGEIMQSGSVILRWKIKANSDGTKSTDGPTLLGPYTNFYYND